MLTDLKKRISREQISFEQISDNDNQILDKADNKKFVSKKFRTEIDFKLRDDLVYYFDKESCLRLYISRSVEEDIFKTIYNNNYYSGYYCCLIRINKTLFISRALNKIRIYVKYCSVCQINQTKRYRLYNKLIPIFTESISFYTIAIDYIIELFGKYNCLLTITDKFSCCLQLISDYITDFAIV